MQGLLRNPKGLQNGQPPRSGKSELAMTSLTHSPFLTFLKTLEVENHRGSLGFLPKPEEFIIHRLKGPAHSSG
jgi:hypothetical protein